MSMNPTRRVPDEMGIGPIYAIPRLLQRTEVLIGAAAVATTGQATSLLEHAEFAVIRWPLWDIRYMMRRLPCSSIMQWKLDCLRRPTAKKLVTLWQR